MQADLPIIASIFLDQAGAVLPYYLGGGGRAVENLTDGIADV